MDKMKKTLVMGASTNTARYSYLAVKRLKSLDHQVIAFGKTPGLIGEIHIETTWKDWQDVDTVTLYLNAEHQKKYYSEILSLKPKRIIFNPGAENEELEELAKKQQITTLDACTLVMLSTGQY
jgi:uncharacterized protein